MRLQTTRRLLSLSLLATTVPQIMIFSTALEAAQRLRARAGGMVTRDLLGLFSRDDDGCSSVGLPSGWTSCGMGLPNNFCCNTGNGDTCNSFNDGKSAICCPKGQNCNSFVQIPCNAQGLNVSTNANASLHSTQIANGLVNCGTNCCPVGYACATDNSGTCTLQGTLTNNSSPTAGTSTSAPPTSAPTANSSSSSDGSGSNSSPSTSATPASISMGTNVGEANQCAAFPTTAILVGFFPGFFLGCLLTIATIVCLGRGSRRAPHNKELEPSGSPMPNAHATVVSDPIYHDTGATRVDFLRRMSRRRRTPGSPSGGSRSSTIVGQTPVRNSARVRSLFSSRKRDAADEVVAVPDVPRTPTAQLKREPSMESIMIFSPPESRGGLQGLQPPGTTGSNATRWEDIVGGAGGNDDAGLGVKRLAAPPAFLGSPGMVDPRKRALDGTGRLR